MKIYKTRFVLTFLGLVAAVRFGSLGLGSKIASASSALVVNQLVVKVRVRVVEVQCQDPNLLQKQKVEWNR